MKIKKISENVYEIDKEKCMNVPVKIFASEKILEKIKKDDSIQQAKNVACMPGIQGRSIMLSDAHQGYGFPVGGVAAFDTEHGCISPGGVGFDINCGVRLLTSNSLAKYIGFGRSFKKYSFYIKPTGVACLKTTPIMKLMLNVIIMGINSKM